jgi:hypothetical protein
MAPTDAADSAAGARPVAGLVASMRAPDSLSTHWPAMYMRYSTDGVSHPPIRSRTGGVVEGSASKLPLGRPVGGGRGCGARPPLASSVTG